MSKAMLNIYVRTFRRRMDAGETFEEILASYPRLTDEQAHELKDALEEQPDRGHRGAGKDHRDAVREDQKVIGTACKLYYCGRTGRNRKEGMRMRTKLQILVTTIFGMLS